MRIRTAWPLLLASGVFGQTLPDAGSWTLQGDPVPQMISGMERYLDRLRIELTANRRPSVDRLAYMTGAVDKRISPVVIERSDPIADTSAFSAHAVRWSVLDGVSAEGIHLKPKRERRGCLIAIPDLNEPPEVLKIAQQFAAASYEVLSPVLLDLDTRFSGNPNVRMSKLSHREWIYRMAFPVGRHPLGYEIQKALAAVDWFAAQSCPTSIYGRGDGGWIAQLAALLDSRIVAVDVENASFDAPSLREQPLYRNVFGLLLTVGDKDIQKLLGHRPRQIERTDVPPVQLKISDSTARMKRQVEELQEFTQKLVRKSRRSRDQLWSAVKGDTAEQWRHNAEPLAKQFLDDVIGTLPAERVPLNLRARPSYDDRHWRGWEVQFDVRKEFFGYGVLLVPKALAAGERRPLVVVQHGLHGTPQVFFHQTAGRQLEVYRNFGAQLADLGYIVYIPQNPYTGEFRHLAKMANPLGLSLYSLIRAKYDVMLDWLTTLPFVDAGNIGYYGLSYGGKTALRIPPFDTRYRAVVCGGDFNEWVVKLTTPDEPWSYVYTQEYEILEWNLAHVANHAELATLMAPRAFLVERGHRDGVGIDEWVSYEYARVRRFYDEHGIGDRTGIAFFNGPHRVDGPAAIAFLRKHLGQ